VIKDKSLGQILRSILAIAVPISAGRLLNIFASVVTMMMVARVGRQELAAGLLAVSNTIIIMTLTSTIFYAVGIRIRYQTQVSSPVDIGVLAKNGFFLAVLIAAPAALATAQMDRVLLAFRQDPQLVSFTVDYFYYAGLSMFPLLALMVIGQFYIGIGKPSFALNIELISLPLTILASYGFVLGHFGLPRLGLSGVALANVLVQSIVLIVAIIYLNYKNQAYQLFKAPFFPNWQLCRNLLTLGLPIGIQFGGELAAMAVAVYFMGYFGIDALAALQIANQYSIMVIMLSFGLAQALSLKVSELFGDNESGHVLIKQYLYATLLLLMAYILPIIILFCTMASGFARFYLGVSYLAPDFLYQVRMFFAVSAIFLFLDGIRMIFSGVLRGLHHTSTATWINLASLWLISLPASWFAAFVCKGGPIALRVWFLSGFLVAVILLAMYLYKKLVTAAHSLTGQKTHFMTA